jgi:hypothetical protein
MSKSILIIKPILVSAATWRARVVAAYPSDARNSVARTLLERMAADIAPDEVVAMLDGYSETEIARVANATAKLVGFRYFSDRLEDFIKAVVERIEAERGEWKQAFLNGGAK